MDKEQSYIGSKIIKARPMNSHTFQKEVKKTETADENMEGYLVIYPDGYESWSPKEVFEEAYRLVSDGEKALVN